MPPGSPHDQENRRADIVARPNQIQVIASKAAHELFLIRVSEDFGRPGRTGSSSCRRGNAPRHCVWQLHAHRSAAGSACGRRRTSFLLLPGCSARLKPLQQPQRCRACWQPLRNGSSGGNALRSSRGTLSLWRAARSPKACSALISWRSNTASRVRGWRATRQQRASFCRGAPRGVRALCGRGCCERARPGEQAFPRRHRAPRGLEFRTNLPPSLQAN